MALISWAVKRGNNAIVIENEMGAFLLRRFPRPTLILLTPCCHDVPNLIHRRERGIMHCHQCGEQYPRLNQFYWSTQFHRDELSSMFTTYFEENAPVLDALFAAEDTVMRVGAFLERLELSQWKTFEF